MHGDIIIEAYDAKGQQILGNMDGQTILRGYKDFRRTKAYKRLKALPKEKLSLNGRAVRYRIVCENTFHYEGRNAPLISILEEILK
jgi:hypothetical protein